MAVKTEAEMKREAASRPTRKPRRKADPAKAPASRVQDSYIRLVRRFPLVHLRDDEHLAEALAVVDRLSGEDLDEGGRQYLDVLADLVESYEEEHFEIPDAGEADVLRALMEANGLSQPKLSAAVGIAQSTISAVLQGTRSLTRDQVVKLARHFGVSPAAFLPG